MPIVSVYRHKMTYRGLTSLHPTPGEIIEKCRLRLDFLPRAGELLTVHPTGSPTEKSWTGRVSGVQHVSSAVGTEYIACLTVMDEGNIQ